MLLNNFRCVDSWNRHTFFFGSGVHRHRPTEKLIKSLRLIDQASFGCNLQNIDILPDTSRRGKRVGVQLDYVECN